MHVAWAINRRSWKPLFSRTAVTWSPSQKHGGMTLMTGVLQWMAISSSERIGKEREVVGCLSMLGTASTV